MKIRTFFLVLFVLVIAFLIADVVVKNSEIFGRDLQIPGSDLGVGWAFVLIFLLGVLTTVLVGISRELSRVLELWRHRRERKRSEEIEEEYSRGLISVLEGREEEALGYFRAVLERDSRHFNTLLKLGEVLRSQGRYPEAIEYHRKAEHLREGDTRPLYALCEDYEAKGDMDRARAVLGRIIAVNKGSMAAWRKLRSLHMKEGNWDEALEAHQRVERLAPPGSSRDRDEDQRVAQGIQLERAKARLGAGRAKEATSLLRRLIKEDPRFIPAYVQLGEVFDRGNQDPQAVEVYNQGFEATGSPIFLTRLEEHYLARDNPLAAIEALKRCVGQVSKDTIPRFYLGKLYFRLEMLDDAQAVLSSLEGRASYAPNLHYLLGRIHERRDNARQAATEYRKVIKEMELVQLEYRCRGCHESLVDWDDRCPSCGAWNTVEVNFREEISLEELGLSSAPVYGSEGRPP